MDYALTFYYNLYIVLLATCPFRTGNMRRHIKMTEDPDYMEITISAPATNKNGDFYDYSRAVNEGLNAKSQNRPMTAKEEHNYHWVQRGIKQAANLTTDNVEYIGGDTL